MNNINLEDINKKKEKLNALSIKLKQEFFGIDDCIDKIVDSVKTWYLLPDIISRPVIINLWGLTGVGKTALVRILVSELGFSDKFVEIQMDGVSNGAAKGDSICSILEDSSINESQPGIILLDEFQRFRTLDELGKEIKVERFQDVWMLLSDGKFSSDYSSLVKIEHQLAMMEYAQDEQEYSSKIRMREGKDNSESPISEGDVIPIKRKFGIYPYEAKAIKKLLRLDASVQEIMTFDNKKVYSLIREYIAKNGNKPIDYSKSMVFVCGNLDDAFKMADSVEDCDTDADIFYKNSLKISVIEVKQALAKRFKPEQISRLGNTHIIYPSLNKDAYLKLIKRTCLKYTEDTYKVSNINISVEEDVYNAIYENSVYPAQGTRPVFTSVHKMFGSPTSDAVLWALENKINSIKMCLNLEKSEMIFSNGIINKSCHVDFEIKERKSKYSSDYKSLVAVHEAGHALIHAVLFKNCPTETKINVASFKGGYMISEDSISNKTELLNKIAVSLGGLAAEEVLFGSDLRSTGCSSDISKATMMASNYVRRLGLDGYSSCVFKDGECNFNHDIDGTNSVIDQILKDQKVRAIDIITKYRKILIKISKILLDKTVIKSDEFYKLFKEDIIGLNQIGIDTSGNYFDILNKA